MYQFRLERPGDQAAIVDLHVRALGPGRHALSAYRLREGRSSVSALSHVATKDGHIVGSIRFTRICIGEQKALLLGPLAVDPERHGTGIGLDLLNAGIDACCTNRHQAIILVGDEPYYSRVGFQKLPQGQVMFPGPVDPNRLLGLCIQETTLDQLCGLVTSGAK